MATNLLLSIAWTHVSTRVRQTLVGMFGVAMGVGFTIMMAGLMQGSQIDFLRQLVDTMPHVTVDDERRSVPSQPADQEYAAVGMSNVANVNRRPGIRYPDTVMASLRSWLPGDVAPSVKTTAIVDHGGGKGRRHPDRHRSAAGGSRFQARDRRCSRDRSAICRRRRTGSSSARRWRKSLP